MKKYVLAGTLIVLSVSFLAIFPAQAQKWPDIITIGSWPKGTTSYPVHVAIAKLVTKYCPPSNGVVREFAGGTPGLEALARGDIDTWGAGQNDMHMAYYGEDYWRGKPLDIRLLSGCIYYGGLAFGVRPKEGINNVKDLAGKRCIVKSFILFQNKANELVLKKAGIWDKIKPIQVATANDISSAMIDKKADAFCWSVEGSFALEIKQSVGLEWISLTEEEAGAVSEVPGLIPWTMPRWLLDSFDYPSSKMIRSYGYTFSIAVRPEMADHVAYGILKAVYANNHFDEVRSLSKVLTDTDAKLAVKHFWVPFHSGAVRFYKEIGLWTDEMEAKQKKILATRGFSK